MGAAIFGATLLPETKGKSLAEVSEYFYVCCTWKKDRDDGHEKVAILSDDAHDVTSDSFVYKEHPVNGGVGLGRDTELLRQSDDLLKVEMRFKRRSVELSDLENSRGETVRHHDTAEGEGGDDEKKICSNCAAGRT